MRFPENTFYTKEHMWTQQQTDGSWLAGITDYAQDLLGDIVFVDAPKVGSEIFAEKPCGIVESVKTGSDLHAPLNGVITAVNASLENSPELINDKPYQSWIFKFEAVNQDQQHLMSASDYKQLIQQSD